MSELRVAPDEPTPDLDTEWWWDAIDGHRLTVVRCPRCDRVTAVAAAFCPRCWAEDVERVPASGTATLYTWTTVLQGYGPFAEKAPYVVAMVDLEEGPLLMTEIVDADPATLHAGLRLTVGFRDREKGRAVMVFAPTTDTVR